MFGILTSIDLKDCCLEQITNSKAIRRYIRELVFLINMKKFGACKVVHFGETPEVEGFTMVQLIETSLISGHFVNSNRTAFIDIFSCKDYDSNIASIFTSDYFKAGEMSYSRSVRG